MLDEIRLDWMEGKNEAQLPNIENRAILYEDVEFAKDCDSKTFFNAETINGIPQEDAGPAASQVVNVINNSGKINYSVEGVVQDKFSFEPSKKDDNNTEKIKI